jgi:hypothetical protein
MMSSLEATAAQPRAELPIAMSILKFLLATSQSISKAAMRPAILPSLLLLHLLLISNDTRGEASDVRLQKLNNMKHLLSTQEYEDKQA